MVTGKLKQREQQQTVGGTGPEADKEITEHNWKPTATERHSFSSLKFGRRLQKQHTKIEALSPTGYSVYKNHF